MTPVSALPFQVARAEAHALQCVQAEDRPWRVGDKLGRTVYAQTPTGTYDTDELIGIMETPELAALVVHAHNESLSGP